MDEARGSGMSELQTDGSLPSGIGFQGDEGIPLVVHSGHDFRIDFICEQRVVDHSEHCNPGLSIKISNKHIFQTASSRRKLN